MLINNEQICNIEYNVLENVKESTINKHGYTIDIDINNKNNTVEITSIETSNGNILFVGNIDNNGVLTMLNRNFKFSFLELKVVSKVCEYIAKNN